MNLRKLIVLLLLPPGMALAQYTNVTATVPALANGSYVFDFVNLAHRPTPPLLGGISVFQTQVTGNFDSFGTLSVALADNTQVLPLPSQWKLSVSFHPCAGVTQGFNIQFTASGVTASISSQLTISLPPSPLACQGGGGGGGAGNPSTPPGSIQSANGLANAFMSAGTLNTDAFNTANNGISNAHIRCAFNNCMLMVPPSSTDTEVGGTLAPNVATPNALVEDYRWGSRLISSTNPQPGNYYPSSNQGQYSSLTSSFFSLPNPSLTQGSTQIGAGEYFTSLNPGYSLGDSNCPPNCPNPPHTSAGDWESSAATDWQASWFGSGIRTGKGVGMFCLGGEGDCIKDYTYFYYTGGATTFSDEGAYSEQASHLFSPADPFVSLAAIIDSNHISLGDRIINEGNNRYFMDVTSPILLNTRIAAINPPGTGFPVGTFQFDSTLGSIPVSYAWGTIVGPCQVPIQEGTFASTTCTINVQHGAVDVTGSGAADGYGLFCMAEDQGGNIDIGVKVTSVALLSGTNYTVNLAGVNRSVYSNGGSLHGYFFQGGTCGAATNFNDDFQPGIGGSVAGSVYASIGSYDAHTATYFYPQGSQVWGTAGGTGTYTSTQATSGAHFGAIPLTSLVRSAGTLTASFFTQASNQDFIQGQLNTIITGCSDSSVNGVQSGTTFVSAPGVLSITQAGANTSCPSATIAINTTGATMFWASRVFDVANHSTAPGTNPFDGQSITESYQPHFVVGHTLEMPPTVSATMLARHTSLDTQLTCLPSSTCDGYSITLTNRSSFMGAAYTALNSSLQTSSKIKGIGGTATPGDFARGDGQFTSGLTMQYAPMHYGHLIGWNAFDGLEPPTFRNTDVIWLNSGARNLHFDDPTSTWSFDFSDPVYNVPNNSVFTISNQKLQSLLPHQFVTSQFIDLSGNIRSQIHDSAIRGSLGGAPSYDLSIPAPTVTVNSVGAQQRVYWIQVNTGFGLTWTKPTTLFNSASTPNNTISCSVMPAGTTGTVWTYNNPSFTLVGPTAGQCTSPSATVVDTGAYTVFNGPDALTAGAPFYPGSVLANPQGEIGFTQQDNFNTTTNPLTAGPTWKTGAADPTGSCVTGSFYSNSSGATGHTWWVCAASAWSPYGGGVLNADQCPGANIAAKINACVAALPTDSSGFKFGLILLPNTGTEPALKSWTATVTVGPGISLLGQGQLASAFNCTVTGACLLHNASAASGIYAHTVGVSSTFEGFTITGNGASGQNIIELKDAQNLTLRDIGSDGASEANGACILLHDVNYWTERNTFENVSTLYGCAIGWRFIADTGNPFQPHPSFGYNRFLNIKANPNNGQKAMSIEGNSYFYNSTLRMTANIDAGGTVIHMEGGAWFYENELRLFSEGGGTTLDIGASNQFTYNGQINANGAFTFAAGSVVTHWGDDGGYGPPIPTKFSNAITLPVSSVNVLPAAASVPAGTTIVINDATTFTPGACVGGGGNFMIAVSNGSTWSCH